MNPMILRRVTVGVLLGCSWVSSVAARAPVVPPAPADGSVPPGVASPPGEAAPAAAFSPQRADAELAAVAAEMRRGLGKLRLDDGPEPYRAEVRYVRADLLSVDGSYGGILTDIEQWQTAGTVEVRVGSSGRDNSNLFGGGGGAVRIDVSLEPAPAFMRKKLWLGLDQAFRGASQAFAAKKVVLDRLNAEEPPDWSEGPSAVVHRISPTPAPVDREGLVAMAAALSAKFADWPSIDNGDVHVQVLRSHETVTSSDGTTLQWWHERAVLAVVADTQADDGMHLDHGLALHFDSVPVADADLLRSGEDLVERVLGELDDLARAPMIEEEYDGPLLFTGPAAAQLLASTVAVAASGSPPPLGDSGRVRELEPAWQRRVGKVVMPPFIDLVDDPTDAGFGHYELDAEGVRPAALPLVEEGRLVNLLMTRTPNKHVRGSNGRARMTPSLDAGPAISNLTLRSRRRGSSPDDLISQLLERAREDGYEFAYVIESLRDSSVLGPVMRDSAAAFAGTGKVDLPLPMRVFRVDASGSKTLVRGAILAPASMRALRRIRAVGRETHRVPLRLPVGPFGGFHSELGVEGILAQTVDVEVRSPDLLIEGLELMVERGEYQKLPTLVHPLRRVAPESGAEAEPGAPPPRDAAPGPDASSEP